MQYKKQMRPVCTPSSITHPLVDELIMLTSLRQMEKLKLCYKFSETKEVTQICRAPWHHCRHGLGGWIPRPGVPGRPRVMLIGSYPSRVKTRITRKTETSRACSHTGEGGEVGKAHRSVLYSKKKTIVSFTNHLGFSWLVHIVAVDLETKVYALKKSLRCGNEGWIQCWWLNFQGLAHMEVVGSYFLSLFSEVSHWVPAQTLCCSSVSIH